MNRQRVLLVGVVGLLVVTAGAWMVDNGGIREIEGSVESGEIPFLGGQQSAQASTEEFPRGLSGSGSLDGVIDSGGINHTEFPLTYRRAAKSTHSYTFEGEWTTHWEGESEKATNSITVKKNGSKIYQSQEIEDIRHDYTRNVESYRPSPNAEKLYWQHEKDVDHARTISRFAHYEPYDYDRDSDLWYPPYEFAKTNRMTDPFIPVMGVLKSGYESFAYQGTVTFHGDTVHKYTFDHFERPLYESRFESGHNIGEINSVSGTVLIDQDGLVRKLTYTYDAEKGSGSGEFITTNVGNTTDVEPHWFDEAKQKALEVEGEVELNSNEFTEWYEFTLADGGEPMDSGQIAFWAGNEKRVYAGFDKRIEPGDTIYVNHLGKHFRPQIYVNEAPKKGDLRSKNSAPNHIVISSDSESIAIDAHYTPDSE